MHDKMMWFNEKIPYLFHGNTKEIARMKALPKLEREKAMGMHQRGNKEFSNQLLSGIREIRRKFLEANGLDDTNVLSLHNDAVIFNSRKKIISEIDGIKFHHDNTWDAYIRYDRAEIFYKVNELGNGSLDFKNVGKDKVQEHTYGLNKYMIKVIGDIEAYDKNMD